MAPRRKKISLATKVGGNRRRRTPGFTESLKLAEARARIRANRPTNRRSMRSIRASIADMHYDEEAPHIVVRIIRWILALALLPLCYVTSATFVTQFTVTAKDATFWLSSPFWYFATGMLLMGGWFATGLLWNFFLYLYVLAHELTHIIFIHIYQGRVSEWGVSVEGGYVTTDKSNIVISLAPYFVPLWSIVVVLIYATIGIFVDLSPAAVKSLYVLLGFFWAFHLLWTLWMIPRDQPDLKDNGTFLSLTIIYLANLLILVGLTCIASPDMSFRGYGKEWYHNARELAEFGHGIVRRLMNKA